MGDKMLSEKIKNIAENSLIDVMGFTDAGNRDLIPLNFQGFFPSQFQGKLPATVLILSI